MQVSGLQGLIDVVEGMDITNLPDMLPVLRSITEAASSPPGEVAMEREDSKDAQTPSIPVAFEWQLQLMVKLICGIHSLKKGVGIIL